MKNTLFSILTMAGMFVPLMSMLGDESPKPKQAPQSISAIESSQKKWANELSRIEKLRDATPSPPGGIILTGSSTARMWKIQEALPNLPVVNHGFGGSNYEELDHLLDTLVIKHRPGLVILYSGDNDVKQLKNSEKVLNHAVRVFERILTELPESKLLIVGIKPSQSRWDLFPIMQEVNGGIKAFAEKHSKRVWYFDPSESLLNEEGKVRSADFLKDQLHLSPEGYSRLNVQLKETFEKTGYQAP